MDSQRVKDLQEMLDKRESKVSEFWQQKYKKEASKNWDLFYKRNTTNFFKDRHWIDREFGGYAVEDRESTIGLEIGCGVGNLVFPVLQDNPNLFMYACDFSARAVEFVKQHEEFDEKSCHPFVCDLTKDLLTDNIEESSVDVVSAIFVLSAIPPEKMLGALQNVHKVMKQGGKLLFRDYGQYDAAQIRFKPENKIDQRFYVRQDGTLTYYFTIEEIADLFQKAGFKVLTNEFVHRETVNVKRELKADRIFLQAKFEKL